MLMRIGISPGRRYDRRPSSMTRKSPMLSDLPGPFAERRREKRLAAGGFPLLTPSESTLVDCARRGVGIETGSHLAVGREIDVHLFLPAGELTLLGRVRWARFVGNRRRDGETAPVFRVGLSLAEGPSLDAWERVRSGLIAPPGGRRRAARPRRRIVRWRRPSF